VLESLLEKNMEPERSLITAHASISNHFVTKGCEASAFVAASFGLSLVVCVYHFAIK
jgi:hypothetical protein